MSDASAYAHFVFNAFDQDGNGSISFEVTSTSLCPLYVTWNSNRDDIVY